MFADPQEANRDKRGAGENCAERSTKETGGKHQINLNRIKCRILKLHRRRCMMYAYYPMTRAEEDGNGNTSTFVSLRLSSKVMD